MNAQTSTDESIICQRINSGPWTFRQILIVFICFLFNVVDGYDIVAMSMAAPAVADEWLVEPAALGVIFSAALAGMMIGALFLSPLGDRFGRRRIILSTAALMSLSMFATAYAESVIQLLIIRFITGLAIGGMLASVIAMVSEYAPQRHKSFAIIITQSGYALGAVLVGPISAHFVGTNNWPGIFTFGALFSTALLFFSWWLMPESVEFLATQKHDDKRLHKINRILGSLKRDSIDHLPQTTSSVAVPSGSIISLLGPSYRSTTLSLWALFFLAFWASYFFMNWIPKLFVNAGFDIQQGIFALTVYTIGGLLGALVLGTLSSRCSLTRLIAGMFVVSALLVGLYTLIRPEGIWYLHFFMLAIGFALTGGFMGVYAVATLSYPSEIRATGFGWCVGLGRAGAILSPIIAGYLIAFGWDMYMLFQMLALPAIVIAALLVYSLGRRGTAS